ncbi:MAG TPA: hypothetical protein VJ962_09050 [Clostridia bacterium]|nr:hypothetical protein [Clostridia bacterium]
MNQLVADYNFKGYFVLSIKYIIFIDIHGEEIIIILGNENLIGYSIE